MKRIFSFLLCIVLLLSALWGCEVQKNVPGGSANKTLRLSNFVGVWQNEEGTQYYRFSPSSFWFCYNSDGVVEAKGEVTFDGKTFHLTADNGTKTQLSVSGEGFENADGEMFSRTDSPSSLISSEEYGLYFNEWFEDQNLLGNVLTISQPDLWVLKDSQGQVIGEGTICAYADEKDSLYLHESESGSFFARLSLGEAGLLCELHEDEQVRHLVYSTKENSRERSFYFKEKGVECDYAPGSGTRLLRNGGAVFNDAHDYKKMPVTCSIDVTDDVLDENGLRHLTLQVNYDFKRTDRPVLSGIRFYNSVRFSQYDYYTGQLLSLNDSTGNENLLTTWEFAVEDRIYHIDCAFSSQWEYAQSDDIMVRFVGTYSLTMPKDYDGFVICLRPVFNSYSAQVSGSILPEAGTLMLEDLGDDVEKSIFCRIPAFSEKTAKTIEIAE